MRMKINVYLKNKDKIVKTKSRMTTENKLWYVYIKI